MLNKFTVGDLVKVVGKLSNAYIACSDHGMIPIYSDQLYGSVGIISKITGFEYEVLIDKDLVYLTIPYETEGLRRI